MTMTTIIQLLTLAICFICPVKALADMCFCTAVALICNYITVMTFFMAGLVWDTRRVNRRYGDCLMMCRCKEDSVYCCKGRLLSTTQKYFSGIKPVPTVHRVEPGSDLVDQVVSDSVTITERLFSNMIAPCSLSRIGKLFTILFYLTLIVLCLHSSMEIRTGFRPLDYDTEYR